MKIAILDKVTLGEVEGLQDLNKFGEVINYDITTSDEVKERVKGVEVIITNKVVITKEVMQNSPELKLICIAATGTNNVDLEAAKELGIAVKNVVGYSTKSVAQHTFTLLLSLISQMAYFDEYVKSGEYAQSPVFTHLGKEYWELSGKTIGIIGLGNIGKEVALIASVFGMEVQYYSTSGKNNDSSYKQVDLKTLLKTSDVVSIHAPLNEATQNLIGAKELSLMKSTSVLLNTGRGGIVVEEDLIGALNNNELFAAGLDVLATEPIKTEYLLPQLNEPTRLLITPHIAWASIEARVTLVKGIINNINDYLAA